MSTTLIGTEWEKINKITKDKVLTKKNKRLSLMNKNKRLSQKLIILKNIKHPFPTSKIRVT